MKTKIKISMFGILISLPCHFIMSRSPFQSIRLFSTALRSTRHTPRCPHRIHTPTPGPTIHFRSYAAPSPFPVAQRRSILRPLNFLVVLIPFFTFSLGIWQVKRLRWKLDLIDEIQRNVERDPMILPPNIKYVHLTLHTYHHSPLSQTSAGRCSRWLKHLFAHDRQHS